MKNLICLLLIGAILFSASGCNKIKNAVNATARLSRQVENLVEKNEQAYNAGNYDKATALKIAMVLKTKAIPLTRAFNQSVKTLSAKYSDPKKVPANAFKDLRDDFFEVESAVRDVLVIVGTLSEKQSLILDGVLAAIKQALAIIGDTFSIGQIHIGGREEKWSI